MSRLSLWNSGRKGADYKFIDRIVSEYVGASGTAVYVHKYEGPHDQREPNEDGTPLPPIALNERSIQDVLFLENRDRKYSKEVYELRACYNVQDNDIDMRMFGAFLTSDTLFLEFHLNDMLALIGRKLMPGDVLELPHQRDDALLDPDAPAINKFYVVEDGNRASDGYSPTWYPHLWRIKCTPMHDAQEYADILDKQAQNPFGIDNGRLGDLMSSVAREFQINEAVVDAAKANVSRRNFETRQFWVIPGEEALGQNPWVYAGDGNPPNGAIAVVATNQFPANPQPGDYCLRTDYDPHTLFRYKDNAWRMQEQDYRKSDWSAAHRLLFDFINNDKQTTYKDGTTAPEKQPLFQAVKPRADL